jgi:hypothetical protein
MVDKRGLRYLALLPKTVPDGEWLVHNNVRPTSRLGSRGFRAWLADPDDSRWKLCDCDWAPELGDHYRLRARSADG